MREQFDNWSGEPAEDDYGFWKDEPTSRLGRITQSIPKITQALPKIGQALHRHHDEWDFGAEQPAPAPQPRVYDHTLFDDLDDEFDEVAPASDNGFQLRPAPVHSVPRPTGPAVRKVPRTGDTAQVARPSVRRPAAPPRPAGSRQHTGSLPRVTEAPATVPVTRASARTALSGGLQQVDPLLRRVGTLALVIALCIPVALGLRSGSDSASTAPAPEQPATIATGTAPGSGDAVDPAAPSEAAGDGAVATSGQAVPATAASQSGGATASNAPATTAAPVTTATPATTAAAPPSATQPAQVETAEAAPACAKTYTVVNGDYWIFIAQKVSVKVTDLYAINKATAASPLFPGQTVCLPANASAPTTAVPTTAAPTTQAPTTTAKPTTTTAAPTTVPTKTNYTRAEVEAIIRQVWPDDLEDEAVRIATRESNLVPTAKNYCCYGLFQIYFNVHKGWLAGMGVTSAQQLLDPMVNAYVAVALYNRAGGWGPWAL